MIAKYTLPEMGKIFSTENRYQLMLDVTVIACEALADIGLIPNEAYREIRNNAKFDMQRILEIESQVKNNTVAFILNLSEYVGQYSHFLHLGLSAADLADTVTSLQVKQCSELLHGKLNQLRAVLVGLANEYKFTLTMGRTHGTSAEPTTFGLKMALWVKEIDRSMTRLNNARNVMMVGKMSGVTGTFASVDPHVETFVCRRLGLHPAYVTSQLLQRDRLAEYITTLAIIGSSLDKFATEIRNLQRSDVHEVEENIFAGQMVSTSLPHKRRPLLCERISGMSRVLRGNAVAAMENVMIWHEHDDSHSPVERIVIPDSCILLDYMLHAFTEVMTNLNVFPDNMRENINKSLGLVFSQRVLLALLNKGLPREIAYEMVMRNAIQAWEQKTDFQFLLIEDDAIRKHLTNQEIMDLFDYDSFRRHVNYIFDRAGI